MTGRALLRAGWAAALAGAVGVRAWNALAGPRLWGYDAWGHLAYVLFLDFYRALPFADQGWSYFHPPLHYALGWILAQLGSADALMRGMALLGSAESLAVAALAARLVRALHPARPGLALLAFAGLAFLPVHLYVSPMPGNKLTEALLSSAAIALFARNQLRERPARGADAAVGALLGLALLAAMSGLLAALAVAGALGAELLPRRGPRASRAPTLARAALILGLALALCAPWYARNLAAFGAPFHKSSDFPAVREVESRQPPGARSWRDYVSFPLGLLLRPDPRTEAGLHSVWGSAYVSAWADVSRESEREPSPQSRRSELRWHSRMALLGLPPTLLFLLGTGLALRDTRRGSHREVYIPLLLLLFANLAAFAAHAAWTPRWPAVKASYLLGASLPFGVFLARGALAFAGSPRAWLRALPAATVGLASAAAALVGLEGAVLPPRGDSPAAGAVYFSLGEYEPARRLYGRLAAGAPYPVPWLENLAALEIAEGHYERARQLYARAAALAGPAGPVDPERSGRLAVATALAGDAAAALQLLDAALALEPASELRAELLANRGAIRAARGDAAAAEPDLRAALALEPELWPAQLDLAHALANLGRAREAELARAAAAEQACRAPRRYPHAIGSGEVIAWGVGRRWLLLADGQGLRAALPAAYRDACRRLATP